MDWAASLSIGMQQKEAADLERERNAMEAEDTPAHVAYAKWLFYNVLGRLVVV